MRDGRRGAYRDHVVEVEVVQDAPAVVAHLQHVREAHVHVDVVELVRVPRVDRGAHRLVVAGEREVDLGLLRAELLERVGPVKQAIFVDPVHRHPRQDEEERLLADERQLDGDAHRLALRRGLRDEHDDLERGVDHLVSTPVGHPEHQVRDAGARGDRDLVREEDAGRGARELGERDARHQRDGEHADERLHGHEQVAHAARRGHHAVADRRERLHREVKSVLERAGRQVRDRARDEQVQDREDRVEEDEGAGHDAEELEPRPREDPVVDVVEGRAPLPDREHRGEAGGGRLEAHVLLRRGVGFGLRRGRRVGHGRGASIGCFRPLATGFLGFRSAPPDSADPRRARPPGRTGCSGAWSRRCCRARRP